MNGSVLANQVAQEGDVFSAQLNDCLEVNWNEVRTRSDIAPPEHRSDVKNFSMTDVDAQGPLETPSDGNSNLGSTVFRRHQTVIRTLANQSG